jgi:hypothetical protein
MDQHFSLSRMVVILVPFWTGEVKVKATTLGQTLWVKCMSETLPVSVVRIIVINERERLSYFYSFVSVSFSFKKQ